MRRFKEDFEKQGGISFVLIAYTKREEYYYLTFSLLKRFWQRKEEGGRKSFRYEELEPEFFLQRDGGALVPYLEGMKQDLERRGPF